jgi:hypothetical protein
MERYRELAELQREWKPPAELSGSSSREVELSGGGKALACLSVALMLGAIASIVFLSREASRQAGDAKRLFTIGRVADGVVTRHWRSGGEESQRRIAYEFQHDGRTYAGAAKTPKRIWATLAVGSPVSIRYLPEDPARNHPARWRAGSLPLWLPPALSAVLVAVAFLLVWLIRRQTQLLSEGRPAPARIVKHTKGQHGKSYKYEFPVLGGGTMTGGGGETSRPPAIGATICIVYDRDNPGRNSPYPFCLVRVVR